MSRHGSPDRVPTVPVSRRWVCSSDSPPPRPTTTNVFPKLHQMLEQFVGARPLRRKSSKTRVLSSSFWQQPKKDGIITEDLPSTLRARAWVNLLAGRPLKAGRGGFFWRKTRLVAALVVAVDDDKVAAVAPCARRRHSFRRKQQHAHVKKHVT